MTIPRREFLGRMAGASAVTIVPRRVLGGRGYTAPSDMVLLAQVGCGTQSFRQVSTNMVRRPDLQFVAVADPNRSSDDYVDWSPFGVRATVRRFLGDPLGAIKRGAKSRGSFEAVEPLAQAVAMAGIALRVPYKRLVWDAREARFTNSDDANRLLRRSAWRPGWETLVG